MPRVKNKPRPFRPACFPEDEFPGSETVEDKSRPAQTSTSVSQLSTPADPSNSRPSTIPIAIPLTTLVATSGCFSALPTVAMLTQSGETTTKAVTNPLVSATIIPTLTTMGFAFPTVPTLAIDLGSMIWTGASSHSTINPDVQSPPQPSATSTPSPVAVTAACPSSAPKSDPIQSAIAPIKPSSNEEQLHSDKGRKPYKKDRELTHCAVCHKLMRRGSIREHMDRHNNSGRFRCSQCGKTFSRASAREKHVRIHTGEKPYACPHCSKAYRQRVHLNEHMRSHTGTRPYVCLLCGFALSSKSLLNRHARTHWYVPPEVSNPQPHGLVKIAMKNTTTDTINTSMKNNISVSPYLPRDALEQERLKELWRKHMCDQCSTGFPTLQALRSHRMTTHGFVPSHPCPQCSERFSSNKLRKQHLRLKHPQFCPVCSKQMAQRRRWFLEAHIRDEHPEVSAVDVIGPSPLTNFWRKRFETNPSSGTEASEPQPANAKPTEMVNHLATS